ncbi:MAG: hypothetical protein LC642_00650 [Verrucomicrobiaceae bacterium]|nr:hypothetical protein [Verrucomicrobiaceae bacterium]
MKWLSAGLTFFNATTVCALLAGMVANGLSRSVAVFSLLLGLTAALVAYWVTDAAPLRRAKPAIAEPSSAPPARKRRHDSDTPVIVPPSQRYRSIWLWLLAACFTIFAVRSFCWLIYADGNELKVQSPNNLGDLSIHLTYIRQFASGVPLWPDNPLFVFSKLRYPAGTDIFNAVLVSLGFDLTRGLVWTGLLASVATFYAFYRWAGNFGIAAFLFNGGLASYQIFEGFVFQDYQGANTIAWKSIPLAMFVTQRGLLYALPAGLLLLYQWRARFYPSSQEPALTSPPSSSSSSGDQETITPTRPPLPLWLELSLYATLPLYHIHTFLALSVVLAFLFLLGNAIAQKQLGILVGAALVPASFFVWLVSDNFNAGSVLEWKPGWVQDQGDFAMPFFQFWLMNFGAWIPLVLFFIGITALTVGKQFKAPDFKIPATVAFLLPAAALFLLGCFVKFAPWEWDNIKIIVWAYFIILPFLWTGLIAHWPIPLRAIACAALFASGFVSLFGSLGAGRTGFGIADRAELDAVEGALRKLPKDARFAGFPTYNHPVLLHGRKMVMGYPGHLWTQGFNYSEVEKKLQGLMKGAPNWKENARSLGARYLFWGREEKLNYPMSTRPWERESALIAAGDWGAIYDLESRRSPQAPPPAASVPRQ